MGSEGVSRRGQVVLVTIEAVRDTGVGSQEPALLNSSGCPGRGCAGGPALRMPLALDRGGRRQDRVSRPGPIVGGEHGATNRVAGGPGHRPGPPGDPLGRRRLRPVAPRLRTRSVGRLPTETGGSPVPPVLETRRSLTPGCRGPAQGCPDGRASAYKRFIVATYTEPFAAQAVALIGEPSCKVVSTCFSRPAARMRNCPRRVPT